MSASTKIEKLTREELKLMIELCNFVYPDFENQSLSRIARIISKEFKTICLEEDLENYYSDDLVDDYLKEVAWLTGNYNHSIACVGVSKYTFKGKKLDDLSKLIVPYNLKMVNHIIC